MPLIINRKRGERTSIEFPNGVAIIEATRNGHRVVSIDDTLTHVTTQLGELAIMPKDDEWPVCIVANAGRVEGSAWAAYAFDAPDCVHILRDNAKRRTK